MVWLKEHNRYRPGLHKTAQDLSINLKRLPYRLLALELNYTPVRVQDSIEACPRCLKLHKFCVFSTVRSAQGHNLYSFEQICFAAGVWANNYINSRIKVELHIVVGAEMLQAKGMDHPSILALKWHDYVHIIVGVRILEDDRLELAVKRKTYFVTVNHV